MLYNMAAKSEHVISICMDEIALEGLEGITLNSLWVRLLLRPGFKMRIDDRLKQYFWTAILGQEQLHFFTLDKAREPLTKRRIDKDNFSVTIVTDEPGIYGSCSDFRVRKDVTKSLRRTKKYADYSTVAKEFNNRLVIVASQVWRARAILGGAMDVHVFLEDYVPLSSVHYAMLERIARSRHYGIKTCGDSTLHKLFNVRAKDVFYLAERYSRLGVLYKRSCEMPVDGVGFRSGAFICLQRFSPKNLADTPEMEHIIGHLRLSSAKRSSKSDLTKNLKLDKWELQRAIVRLQDRVSVDNTVQYTRKGNPKKKHRMPRDQVETVCLTDESSVSLLVEREDVDQEQYVDSEEDSSDDEMPNWTRWNYYRTVEFQIVDLVRSSGNEGVSLKDINENLRISRKVLSRRLGRFEKDGIVKALLFTAGRARKKLYYDPMAEPPSADLFAELYKKTSVDFSSLPNFALTDRSCKRLMAIIDFINERRIVTSFDTGQMLREREKDEGYDFCIDKNATATLLSTLVSKKLIKVYQTVLLDTRNKMIEFFCSPNVQSNDPALLSRMRKAQLKYCALNAIKAKEMAKQSTKSKSLAKTAKKIHAKKRSSQGKFVRMQLLHEFIYYLVRDYAGESLREASDCKSTDAENRKEPVVYVDEVSWRRYLPPLPPRNDLPSGWFHVDDLVLVLPLSIACQILMPSEEVDCMTEYLCDRVKRHYTLGDLPYSAQNPYTSFTFVRQRLINLCWKLSYLGLIACSNMKNAGGQLKDEYYFVHDSAPLVDTSTSAAAYMTVSEPMSQYASHVHTFLSLHDVRIYWLHLRAIAFSTWLGMRSAKRTNDYPRLKDTQLKASLPRYSFDQVKPLGEPVGPRIGAAGLNPYMFAHRVPNWVVNTRNACELENLEQMKLFALTYSKEVTYRVARLNKNWQSSSFMIWSKYKELSNKVVVKRRKFVPHVFWRSWVRKRAPAPPVSDFRKTNVNNVRARSVAQLAKRKSKRKGILLHPLRRMYQRQSYTTTELRLLVLLKSSCEVVATIFPGWYDSSMLVEMTRKHLPAFLTRHGSSVTSKVTALLSSNRKFNRNVVGTVRQLSCNKEIMQIVSKYRGSSSNLSAGAKNQVFTEVFNSASQIYKPNEKEWALGLNSFKLQFPSSEARSLPEKLTEEAVRHWALSNVIVGSLGTQNNSSGIQAGGEHRASPTQLFTAVSETVGRSDESEASYRQTPAEAATLSATHPFSRDPVTVCGQFRGLFAHNFCPQFLEDALALRRQVSLQPSKQHNVLGHRAGYVCSLAALMNRHQVSFEIVIPSDLLANDENGSGAMHADGSAPIEIDASKSHWSFFVGVNGWPSSGPSCSTVSTNSSSPLHAISKMTILSFRRKLDEEYQRIRANQSLRTVDQATVHGQGTVDPWEIAKRKLVKRFQGHAPELRSLEGHYKGDLKVLRRIFNSIEQSGFEGVSVDQPSFLGRPEESRAVHFLIENELIVRVGIVGERLVSRSNFEPWTLPALNTFSLETLDQSNINSLYRMNVDDEPPAKKGALEEDFNSETCLVLPRRWIRLDGSINRAVLRWLCEGIFTRILALPGVLEEDLCKHYASFLAAYEVRELLQFLIDSECIERMLTICRSKKFTVFSCSSEAPVERVSFLALPDSVTRFATIFDGVALPEGVNV
uniref:B-block binding subunit of TFIIIC domain-containing protein n=1 Tax=Trichuris muris TaxID=70415 RepID=A0A5S6R5H9_TRIMR